MVRWGGGGVYINRRLESVFGSPIHITSTIRIHCAMRFSVLQAAGLFTLAVQAAPAPQAVTTTEADPRSATGTPGRIPSGNPPEPSNTYPNTGNLTQPEPMPYMPAGGANTNKTSIPVYQAFSDFDWHSLSLTLYQEYIELDLFQAGLDMFSDEDFSQAGVGPEARALISQMAQQEIGKIEPPFHRSCPAHRF